MFDKRDTNRDNRLTREEFLQGQPDPKDAPNRFAKFDVNTDGFLSREEFVSSGKTATKP
jgi:iduronate 2-sulfatase